MKKICLALIAVTLACGAVFASDAPERPVKPHRPGPVQEAKRDFSDSGSMSRSCSGNLPGLGYFYIYAYQYAYIYNSEVRNENHSFSFSGFLGDPEDYVMRQTPMRHFIVYEGPQYSLAIPWDSDHGIYVNIPADSDIDSENENRRGWTLLCK